jgi:hypothetical protein
MMKYNFIVFFMIACIVSSHVKAQIIDRVNDGIVPIVTLSGVADFQIELNFDKDYENNGTLSHYPNDVYANPARDLTRVTATDRRRYRTPVFGYGGTSTTRGKMRINFNGLKPILDYTLTPTVDGSSAMSPDGQFLMRPNSANSIDKIFIGVLSRSTPINVPDGFRPITSAVAVSVASGGTSMPANYVRWKYNILGGSNGAPLMRLYRWNPSTLSWVFAKGCLEVNTESNEVFLDLGGIGTSKSATYCLFAPIDNGVIVTPVSTTGTALSYYAPRGLQLLSSVGSGSDLTVKSSGKIKLEPGFLAVSGSKFRTRLVCGQTSTCNDFTYCSVSTPPSLVSNPDVFMASASPEGDLPVDISEVEIAALPPSIDGLPVLFPNPVVREFTLNYQLNIEQPVTITIYNLQGKEVLLKQVTGIENWNTTTLQVGDLAPGSYIVQLIPEKQEVVVFRMIKM